MDARTADLDQIAGLGQDGPVTLHRVMQTMIAEGLKARYQPARKLSHELFVLLLQLKEEERRATSATPSAMPSRRRANAKPCAKLAPQESP